MLPTATTTPAVPRISNPSNIISSAVISPQIQQQQQLEQQQQILEARQSTSSSSSTSSGNHKSKPCTSAADPSSQNEIVEAEDEIAGDDVFVFKLRDPSNLKRVHRFIASATRLDRVKRIVMAKLYNIKGGGVSATTTVTTAFDALLPVLPQTSFTLGYVDDEGDTVELQCDYDLRDAVAIARNAGWKKLQLNIMGRTIGECYDDEIETTTTRHPSSSSTFTSPLRAASFVGRKIVQESGEKVSSRPKPSRMIVESDGQQQHPSDSLIPILAIGAGIVCVLAFFAGKNMK